MAMKLLLGALFILMLRTSNNINADVDADKLSPSMLEKFDGNILRHTFSRSPEHFRMRSRRQSGTKLKSCQSCGMANPIKEIRTSVINGDDVRPSYKYPWMVQIHINGGACAGAIISEYFVLTATHCVIKKREPLEFVDPKDVVVNFVTSTYELRKGPPVQKVIPHLQYKAFIKHDIALLKFKEKITCDRFTTPICLPPTNFVLSKDTIVTGSGWGKSATGNQTSSDNKLKEGKFMVEKIKACPHNPRWPMVYESFYCLKGTNKQMACSGDSGGPAFYEHEKKFYVIGVQSFGYGCDVKQPFNYVTSVPHHLSWIKENMK